MNTLLKTVSAAALGFVASAGLAAAQDDTLKIGMTFQEMNNPYFVSLQEALNEAAAAFGLTTGIDIPSRGSCTLGGVISTNAGGIRVIRYGMTRDNVLGLTAVLSDGTVLEGMNTLIKINNGYDLKQLFIGSEGTLGVITAAVLKLFPRPAATALALLACPGLEAAQALLMLARIRAGGDLMAYEAMWPTITG